MKLGLKDFTTFQADLRRTFPLAPTPATPRSSGERFGIVKSMNNQVSIRPVGAHEIEALSTLASRTYADAFGASMSAADLAAQLAATRSEAYFRSAVQTDAILVAVVDGGLVGYVQLSDVRISIDGAGPEDQELFALYVDVAQQGQGIGNALMEAALRHERFVRARRIYLDVWDENARAIALYMRFGFKAAGRRDFVVDGRVVGSDLVMMRDQRS
jgi:ribosomal protein S18 acetylase RimI-like enzyme